MLRSFRPFNLPNDVGISPKSWFIDFSSNEFSGEIPTKFYQDIEILALGENTFTGNLPRNLTYMSHLKHLDIHDNKITGELPELLAKYPPFKS